MTDTPLPEDRDDSQQSPPENPADSQPGLFINEPPIAPDDTKPKAPAARPEALHHTLSTQEPPLDPTADTAERPAFSPAPGRVILLILVMAGSLCMCMLLVSLAGVAGYRDGLATNDAKVTQTLATGIAEQYAIGVEDLQAGYAELAEMRFAWIVETLQAPTEVALDSPAQLAMARTIAAYTPTPLPTTSPMPSPTLPATETPTFAPTNAPTNTLSPLEDPDYLYEQAARAMRFTDYEDAIAWLDSLRALTTDYRSAEVEAMLMEALTEQGRIYLYGLNEDGVDKLQRGVYLIERAQELGTVKSQLVGQATFVQSYILGRDYVNGGFYANALPILEDLCNWNCEWSYPNVNGVSVRDLLNRARQGQ